MRLTATLWMVILLVLTTAAITEAQSNRLEVRGILMLPDGQPCDRCEIRLETVGRELQRIDTEGSGRYIFRDVDSGRYWLRASLEGFEDLDVPIEVEKNFNMIQPVIVLSRKLVPSNAPEKRSDVIDVSTVLSNYPRQAVDLQRNAAHNLKKGQTEKALAQLEQAVRIAPDFYLAHMDLGNLYKASGRLDDAAHEFETAVRLNKSSAEPLVALTEIYLSREQTQRAIEVGEEAVKKDSGSPGAFLNLGLALYRSSQLDRAEDAFKHVLSLAPTATQVRLLLANVYLRQQNWNLARKELDTYLAENPNAPEQAEVEKIRRGLPPTAWRGKN